MRKIRVKRGSVEEKLSSLIIESKFKLLEEDFLNEGFFENIAKDYKAERERQKRREPAERIAREQKAKERERIVYLRKNLPIPEDLTKESLKQYYLKNSLPVPSYLEGKEREDSTRTSENEDSLITKFSNMLGLHPDNEEKLRKDIKSVGGGVKATGNFLNNLYKKLTGTPFIATSGEVVATGEELTGGPDTSMDSSSGSIDSDSGSGRAAAADGDDFEGIPGYGVREGEIEGIPVDTEMYYIFVSSVVRRANRFLGASASGDAEADVTMYVRNEIESNLLNSAKTDVIIDKIPGKKKFKWGQISRNIKKDKSNDKSDFDKYVCGHYFIGKDSIGKHGIYPIGKVHKNFIDTGALK
jgi:hypothetical protein